MPELKQVYTTVGSVLDLGDPGKAGVGEARKATLVLDWGQADDRERDQKTARARGRARGWPTCPACASATSAASPAS